MADSALAKVKKKVKPLPNAQTTPVPQVSRLDAGLQAMSAGRNAEARQAFEAAYKESHLSEALLQLGRLAQSEGKEVRAADLFRRYLDSLTAAIDDKLRTELTWAIAKVRTPYIDASIVGEKGWLLRIDGLLVGELPLPGSVLLEPGARRFTVESQGRKVETSAIEIPADRQLTIGLSMSRSQALIAVVSLLPAVVLLMDEKLKSLDQGAEPELLSKAIQTALQGARAALVRKDRFVELDKKSALASCLGDAACQEQLGQRLSANYVLTLKRAPGDAILLRLLDVRAGQIAVERTASCAACTPRTLGDKLGQLVREALPAALSRARGTLEVASTPAGARVLVGSREVGRTPYQHELFADNYPISVEQSGYTPDKSIVQVKPGETSRLEVSLSKSVAVDSGKNGASADAGTAIAARRPLWRILGGLGAIAVGVALVGAGASALAVNGQCKGPIEPPQTPETCSPVYYTSGVGGGLVGAGAAVVLGGTLFIAWPPSKR